MLNLILQHFVFLLFFSVHVNGTEYLDKLSTLFTFRDATSKINAAVAWHECRQTALEDML